MDEGFRITIDGRGDDEHRLALLADLAAVFENHADTVHRSTCYGEVPEQPVADLLVAAEVTE